MAAAPSRTIAEGPPYRQPPGGSGDGSNWIFFDGECGRRKLHEHRHHPMIAADGRDPVEARREPASALETLPPPVKPLQISLNGESAAKPEAKADGRGNWREHKRAAHPQTARRDEPPRIPPAVYGYYAYAAMPARGGGRRGEGAPVAPTPDRSPATGSATASYEPNATSVRERDKNR